MIKKIIITVFYVLSSVYLTELKAQSFDNQIKKLSDASNDVPLPRSNSSSALTPYTTALQQWKTVADVHSWIKEHFSYDFERAKQLAENSPTREITGIYSPEELYQSQKGVCIDLTRFTVETVNTIDTTKHLQYLMIEFEPIVIDSMIIKKHWAAIYQEASGYYIFADSKRPGYMAGPYKNVSDFITEYQGFRARKIVSYRVLLSYQKKKMSKIMKKINK
ncbi:MAG: transglutaminase-like domain-containing protein [Spirosomataceae bacterium]